MVPWLGLKNDHAGEMCVVAQGSSVQLLIAILMMYMRLGKLMNNLFCLYVGCFYCSELLVFLSFHLSCSTENGSFSNR